MRYGGRGSILYSYDQASLSFSEPVSLGYGFSECILAPLLSFSALPPNTGETRRLERTEVKYFPIPRLVSFDKTVSFEGRTLLWRTGRTLGYFKMITSSHTHTPLLWKDEGIFLRLYKVNLLVHLDVKPRNVRCPKTAHFLSFQLSSQSILSFQQFINCSVSALRDTGPNCGLCFSVFTCVQFSGQQFALSLNSLVDTRVVGFQFFSFFLVVRMAALTSKLFTYQTRNP